MRLVARAPRISVVLPVRDGQAHLAEAVESVLSQSFGDFELLVVDDGSRDRTAEILAGIEDRRLRVIGFADPVGLVAALNCGLAESRGEFVARMDADDVCLPHRFAKQVAFLEGHPDVALCGTWTRTFGERRTVHRLPVAPQQVRAHMFFGGAIDHPTVMMRRSFIRAFGLAYDDGYRHAEDFDFMIRAAEAGRLANLPEVLLRHRAHAGQVSVLHRAEQAQAHRLLLLRQLRALIRADTQSEALHLRLALGKAHVSEMASAERWLGRLERANAESSRYDRAAFGREIRRCWFYAHRRAAIGAPTLRSYWRSPLCSVGSIGLARHLGLISACLVRGARAGRAGAVRSRA